MSSFEKRPHSAVLETNLDNIEVDDEGNVVFPDESSGDRSEEAETSMEVDEDGNLRIQSASRLLNEMNDGDRRSSTAADDSPSAEEQQSLQRRQSDRRHYSSDGTAEEETGMTSIRNQRCFSARRYPLILARDSFTRALNDERDGARPHPQNEDLHAIELTVLEHPQTGSSVDLGWGGSVHSLETGHRESHAAEQNSEKNGLGRFPGIVGRALSSSSPNRLAIIAAIVVLAIGVLLTVTLVPTSFVYVEYHELALAKSRVTGKVNKEDVYYPGCHLLTPDVELVRFKGTAHFVEQNIEVVTSDRLSFRLGISLQYFIKPRELGQLYAEYAHNYEPVVNTMIGSTLQNTAVVFSLDSFRHNRSHVEHTLRQAVALKLSGNCCPSCCPYKCSGSVNCRSCQLAGRGCSRGIHMEMKFFQMGALEIPEEVAERFLRQTILLIEAEKELFLQKHAVVTKISQQMQKDILNRASEIREAASAEAQKIQTVAEADYEKQLQTSYAKAMKKFFQRLNITQEDHKLSFMYVRALEDISDNLYNLNYDKMTSIN